MSKLTTSFIALTIFYLSSTLPGYGQGDCDSGQYPNNLTFDLRLEPPGPYNSGDAFELVVSVSEFANIFALNSRLAWDPNIICFNADTIAAPFNPQVVLGFPSELQSITKRDAATVASTGILPLGFVDFTSMTNSGVTQPDGTDWVRISFIACGDLGCADFFLLEDPDDPSIQSVTRITVETPANQAPMTCTQNGINLNIEPQDEVCIECGAIPSMINQSFCVNPAGELELTFSACGEAPFTWSIGAQSGTIATVGDLVTVIIPNATDFLEILDANGVADPGDTGFGLITIDGTAYEQLTLAIRNDNPPNCSYDIVDLNYVIDGGDESAVQPKYDIVLNGSSGAINENRFNADKTGFFEVPPGGYQITATDEAGCSVEQFILITAPDPIELEILQIDSASCEGATDWAVTIVPTGGTPQYRLGNIATLVDTFFIDGFDLFGDTSQTFQVFDANGCIENIEIIIPVSLSGDLDIEHELVPTDCDMDVGWTSTAMLEPGTYIPTLRNTDTNDVVTSATTGQATFLSENLAPGNYRWTFVNIMTNCRGTLDFVVPTLFPSRIQLQDDSTPGDCGVDNGIATVAVLGGTMPFTYEWEDFPTINVASIPDIAGGTYAVTVTDAYGCFSEIVLDLSGTGYLNITEAIVRDSLDCQDVNSEAVLGVMIDASSQDYTITWTDDMNQVVGTGPLFNSAIPGDYTVTVSLNGSSCMDVEIVNLPGVTPFTFNLVATNPINCGPNARDGEINVEDLAGGSGNYAFEWMAQNAAGDNLPLPPLGWDETFDFTNAIFDGNIFTVIVEDTDTGCKVEASVEIMSADEIDFDVTATLPSCPGAMDGGISISSTGITLLCFSNDNMMEEIIDCDLIGVPAGNYSIQVQEAGTSCAKDTVITLMDGDFTLPFNVNPTLPSCPGATDGSLEISGAGLICRDQNTGDIIPDCLLTDLSADNYDLTIEDATTGCDVDTTIVLEDGIFNLPFSVNIDDPECPGANDGSIRILGNDLICFDNLSGAEIVDCIIENLTAGAYDLKVQDANSSCAKDTVVNLVDPDIFIAEITSSTGVLCFGDSNGAATVEVTTTPQGLTNFAFGWNGGMFAPQGLADSETDLPAGENFVVIGNINGCLDTVYFQINQPDEIFVDRQIEDTDCAGACEGAVTLLPDGGITTITGSYDVIWDDGSMDIIRTDLCAGSYYFTLTDDNDCAVIDSIEITESDALIITSSVSDLGCDNSGQGGSITLDVSGGCGNYIYQWSEPNLSGPSGTGLDIGSYSISVTDDCGCMQIIEEEIQQGADLTAEARIEGVIDCAGDRVCVGVDPSSVSGGNGDGYSFSINAGNRITDLDSCIMVGPGEIFLRVFDMNGECSISLDPIFILAAPEFTVDVGDDFDVELGDEDLFLMADITSSFAVDTIVWESLDSLDCINADCSEVQIFPVSNTTYRVIVTDENGCTTVDEITIGTSTERRVYLPNTFMPGSRTAEDKFMIQTGKGVDRIVDFNIYDRWGNQVFELPETAKAHPTSRDDGWDGRKNNRDVDQGVYTYLAKVQFLDGDVIRYSGHITLIREGR